MVKIKKNNHNGTTLVEVMIVVAIVAVVFSIGPKLMSNMTRFSRLNTARLETQKAARLSLSHINQTLRQALASTIVISQESSQPPLSKISFTTEDGRTVSYYQDDEDLNYVQGGSTKTLSENLRYIAFTPPRTDDDKIVSVSVTFEKETYEGASKALQMAIEKVRIMND